VTDAVYPFHRGGRETRLHEITRRLVREGRDVRIYTMKWWEGDRSILSRRCVARGHRPSNHALYAGDRRSIKQALRRARHSAPLDQALRRPRRRPEFPSSRCSPPGSVCSIRRKPTVGTCTSSGASSLREPTGSARDVRELEWSGSVCGAVGDSSRLPRGRPSDCSRRVQASAVTYRSAGLPTDRAYDPGGEQRKKGIWSTSRTSKGLVKRRRVASPNSSACLIDRRSPA